jgi:hypothetical protein
MEAHSGLSHLLNPFGWRQLRPALRVANEGRESRLPERLGLFLAWITIATHSPPVAHDHSTIRRCHGRGPGRLSPVVIPRSGQVHAPKLWASAGTMALDREQIEPNLGYLHVTTDACETCPPSPIGLLHGALGSCSTTEAVLGDNLSSGLS